MEKAILLSILCVYIAYLLFLFSPFYVENYCSSQAEKITGSNGNKQVPITEEDVKQATMLQGDMGGKISWLHSEELKCERNHSYVVLPCPHNLIEKGNWCM